MFQRQFCGMKQSYYAAYHILVEIQFSTLFITSRDLYSSLQKIKPFRIILGALLRLV